MRNGYRVIDVDSHLIEPDDLFERTPRVAGRVASKQKACAALGLSALVMVFASPRNVTVPGAS